MEMGKNRFRGGRKWLNGGDLTPKTTARLPFNTALSGHRIREGMSVQGLTKSKNGVTANAVVPKMPKVLDFHSLECKTKGG